MTRTGVVGVVLQARMGSTRRPGKVLADLAGRPLVVRILERLVRARADVVAVATPEGDRNAPLRAAAAAVPGVAVTTGPEDDVLERYALAAESLGLDVIVRATADNPFVDPDAVDGTVGRISSDGLDYVSAPGYPAGGGVEAFTRAALETARREATDPAEREHVTPYLYRHPEIFRLGAFEAPADRRGPWRLTVDTDEDLDLARRLHAEAPHRDGIVDLAGVCRLLARRPDLAAINRHVRQKVVA
jgi:spore coat polysaccharide biosynthesis protein SpsF